ncbi:MAG: dienelactone hydrolase family protein [Desulfurivibrio sp.]|nr:dienelactone hydrolase family protein [Desulfurivibrio sp.]
MGEQVTLKASDGFELDGWLERPDGDSRGAIVVIQEIFGVNQHIREVAAGFAADGYVAIAPAVFDRAEKGVELGYDEEGIKQGAGIARGKLDMDKTMADLQAAIDYVGQYGKVGVVGYCFGGLLTWLCAGRADNLDCAVGYYGGGIAGSLDVTPGVPNHASFW